MSTSRKEALEKFLYFDKETVPLNETTLVTPIRLEPTSAIIVIGYVPSTSTSFAINLVCRTSGNIALHFNPRLDRDYIVRNSKVKDHWQEEETCSLAYGAGKIFSRNAYFHIVIFCTAKEFQIAVNGEHFCTFNYRLPLESIGNFEFTGDVEDVRLRKTTLWIYPDPKIYETKRKLELSHEHPLIDDLKVPATISITQEYKHGARIFIKGRLKLLPHSFYVNFQKSTLVYPHPEIALHINPRFHYGNRPACVIMNSWTGGSWGNEERHEGHLSWFPGRDFLLTIRCDEIGYDIWHGNKMIGEFKHRLDPTLIDTLHIAGDIVIYEIFMSYG